MKITSLALAAVVLAACTSAPSLSPTSEPTAVPVATPLPPQFQPMADLRGRLWLDFGLGTVWAVALPTGDVTKAVGNGDIFPTQASVPLSGAPIAYAGSPSAGDGFTGRFGLYVDNKQVLAPGPEFSYQEPAWQADGSTLFFTRVGVSADAPLTGTSGLAIQRLESRDWRLVSAQSPIPNPTTVITEAFQPSPSFDGQWLAYTRVDASNPLSPTRSIRIHNLATNADHEVVAGNRFYDLYGPRWMPDGAHLIFAATEAAPIARQQQPQPDGWLPALVDALFGQRAAQAHTWNGGVWRVNADGSGLVKLVARDFAAPIAAPSPDGRHIAILSLDGVWVANADGSGLRQISTSGGNGSLTWSN